MPLLKHSLRQDHQKIREGWRPLDPGDRRTLGYESRTGLVTGALGKLVTDKELAYAWLYGDLVHADDRAEDRVHGHDIDARFQAGTFLMAHVAIQAIKTLNFLRHLQSEGYTGLEEDVFTERVIARPRRDLTHAKFATAPVGTPVAALEALLDGFSAHPDAGDSDSEAT
ncbi:hypothetical protein [Plantactinospora sp. KLBMP9567]|uniref:hypothetical protein n=1 Tax=Plantactinospora sp. KLBMP9567 TaxID=3085900 RepID=UPI002981DAAF|nr:hypothetical protein [Plantactinospora sp. KLBMP9567]MDW5323700.1 hypothetical protein [Plantactinospora sp. KLBMP9567]